MLGCEDDVLYLVWWDGAVNRWSLCLLGVADGAREMVGPKQNVGCASRGRGLKVDKALQEHQISLAMTVRDEKEPGS